MLESINFVICNLLFSFSTMLAIKNIFRLKTNIIYLFVLQIFDISVSLIYLFCGVGLFVFVILKLLALVIMLMLIAEEYSFYKITIQILLVILIYFSMIGFYMFLNLFYKEVLEICFDKKIAKYYNFVINIAIFLQYFTINAINDYFKEYKINKQILKKVSLKVNGQHIEFTGLIDSGNSVVSKNNKPVNIISLQFLKRNLTNDNYEYITKLINYSEVAKCETIDKNFIFIPIVFDKNIEMKIDGGDCKSGLGIVQDSFYNEDDFQCLIHKNFL